ncbi:MAG: hypothetical protein IT242_07790 [Bacteroidia bacterium]|nr:hypothetical protein [Bacteroidia bacterium]
MKTTHILLPLLFSLLALCSRAGQNPVDSLQISLELHSVENMRDAELQLSKTAQLKGDYKNAILHYQRFIVYRDSFVNREIEGKALQLQMKYEYEKKEAVLKEQQMKERAVTEEKQRKQSLITYASTTGLLIVLIFAGYMLRSLKTTRKQKLIIEKKTEETEEQYRIIEEKNKNITDSINYAARIQRSLLPAENNLVKQIERLKKSG